MNNNSDSTQTRLAATCLLLSVAESDEILDDNEIQTIKDILQEFFIINEITSHSLVQQAQNKTKESIETQSVEKIDQPNIKNVENIKTKTRAKQAIIISEDSSISSIYKIVVESEDQGILQSTVWRQLKLNSRDGSRLSIRLENRSLIKREKIAHLIQNVKKISTYKGHYEYSDIAFIEKK